MAAAHGLLQKARAYLDAQRRLVLVRPGDDGKSTLQIREADRERILEEIEREVSGTRTPVTPELLAFTPRRRGSALPIAVNLAAVAVMAAGIYGAIWLSQQREQAAAVATTTLTTAEGKLLEALKQESEEQLAGKDQEIADIRGKLAGLDQDRERLRTESDARISAKEQELADSMAKTLEAERQKLLASGLSEEAVTKRLADVESSIRAAADRELAEFRQQAEAERVAQEQAAEQLRVEYQQSLTQAQADRSRIQEEAARKQADLEAGYRQKQLALEQDKAAAVAALDALRKAQEKERLVLDQFVSFYREVKDEIAAGRPEAATAVLARFRSYLDDPSVAVLPVMSQRRPVELFLIGSLEEIARARTTAASVDSAATQSLVASASLIAAVAGLVEEGDAAFADKDYVRAREVYLSALAKIPAVQTGSERLADIEKIYAEQDRRAMNVLFSEGNAAYRAGDLDRAVDRYRRGLELLAADRGIADTLVAQLTQIGAIRERAVAAAAAPAAATAVRDAAADEAARAELLAELTTATAEIERLRAEAEAAAAARDEAAAARDAAALARDTALAERDAALAAREAAAAAATAAASERDAALAARDSAAAGTSTTAENGTAVAERDAAVAARDTAIAERDAAIAARDAAVTAGNAAASERDQAVFRLATEQDRRAVSLAGLAAFRARAAGAAVAR